MQFFAISESPKAKFLNLDANLSETNEKPADEPMQHENNPPFRLFGIHFQHVTNGLYFIDAAQKHQHIATFRTGMFAVNHL
jgi:hypothetical protein